MAKPLLTDELWELIEPCLPPPRPRPKGGCKPIDHRRTFTGILFVLKTGIPWEDLPQEMGCGCGMTCWRRLHEWQEAGVWQDVYHKLLNRLRERAGELQSAAETRKKPKVKRAFAQLTATCNSCHYGFVSRSSGPRQRGMAALVAVTGSPIGWSVPRTLRLVPT